MEKSFGGSWFNKYQYNCKFDIAESFVPPFSLKELIDVAHLDEEKTISELMNMQITYGERVGIKKFRDAVSNIYKTVSANDIISTHAGVGANELVYSSLLEGNAEVIVVLPTYQQLKSFPEMIGWKLKEYVLKPENKFCLDYDDIEALITPNTKLISLTNSNNPFGKLFSRDELLKLVEIARKHNLYVLCDEIYFNLGPEKIVEQEFMCDLYEKGISTCSLSKTFSLPGLRMGWIACKDKELMSYIADVRDYHTMENSIITEYIASLAIENISAVLERNQNVISQNFNILKQFVDNNKHFNLLKPDSGPILIVEYDYNIDSVDLCVDIVEKTGVLLMPGYAFGLEKCIRVGLTAWPTDYKLAVDLLNEYFNTMENIK